MLVINPDECIDCGVCEPECPIEAIKSEEELLEGEEKLIDLNTKFSALWPNITMKKDPLADADDWSEKEDKADLFSEKPGDGD